MGNNGARTDRELQALIRKTQRLAKKQRGMQDQTQQEEQEDVTSHKRPHVRYVDTAGERDVLVQDASHEDIFREMKRRDF